jgi:Flp pilus assembly protein TadB
VNEADHPVPAPPAGEEIHLPGPSILPLLCAIAITLIVIGTTITLVLSLIGLILLVIVVIRWVGDTRRDIAELPEEHGH